ncbi:ParB/RepB/Spo0J family partition protein [Neptuniibacter sp. QD37_6]|uniref:ParB/RepB/Spo0J family partition protein n=1 Tax=Neptuniibacter sp. QD37_6 TaxID=3398210 RepID=UPI0039F5039A
MTTSQVIEVPLSSITTHDELQNRSTRAEGIREDREVKKLQDHINALKRDIKAHGQQTPVKVVSDGTTHWLVDGYHRYAAMKQLGADTIKAEVMEGTFETAFEQSMMANRQIIQSLTPKQRVQNAWRAIINPHTGYYRKLLISKGQRALARFIGVSESTIRSMRQQLKEWARDEIEAMHSNEFVDEEAPKLSDDDLDTHWMEHCAELYNHVFHQQWLEFTKRVRTQTDKVRFEIQVQSTAEKLKDVIEPLQDENGSSVVRLALVEILKEIEANPIPNPVVQMEEKGVQIAPSLDRSKLTLPEFNDF